MNRHLTARPIRRGRWALASALGLLGFSAVSAWHVTGPAHAVAIPPPAVAALEQPAPPELPTRAVLAAVAAAPFRPDRRQVPRRYVPPADRVAATPPGRAPPTTVRLIGTAALGGGDGIAALELEGRGRVASVGQQVGPYRVLRVVPGEVTLEGPDSTLVLRVPAPGGGGGAR